MTDESNLADVASDLEDASDGELMRIVYHPDAEGADVERGRTLTQQATAILELRERGYVVDGALYDVEVRDEEGHKLEPEDVEDYKGSG